MTTSTDDANAQLEIGALATDAVVSAEPTISIRDAAACLHAEGIGLLVLSDADGVHGVLSERDVLGVVATGGDLDASASSYVDHQRIQWAAASAPVSQVAREMMEGYVRHVLIAGDNGQPTGVVSMRDLLAVLVD